MSILLSQCLPCVCTHTQQPNNCLWTLISLKSIFIIDVIHVVSISYRHKSSSFLFICPWRENVSVFPFLCFVLTSSHTFSDTTMFVPICSYFRSLYLSCVTRCHTFSMVSHWSHTDLYLCNDAVMQCVKSLLQSQMSFFFCSLPK